MADAALTLWYNFASSKSLQSIGGLGPTLSIVRAGNTATRVNSNKLIEAVAANVARFDHDPVTGLSLGLLKEEARSNICKHSAGFSAPWTSIGTPILNATSVTAPDGSNKGMSINDNSGAAFEGVQQLIPITSAIKTYTYSVYVLKGDINDPTMGINLRTTGGSIPPNNPNLRLNTLTGEIQDANDGIIGVKDKGDWWRINAQITTNTGNTNILIQIFPATSSNGFFVDTTAAAGIVRVWGHQVEEGKHASSYIPTTTVAEPRDADIVDTPFSIESAGTLYIRATLDVLANTTQFLFSIHDGSASNRYGLFMRSDQSLEFFVVDGNVTQAILDSATAAVSDGVEFTAVVAFQVNDVEHFIDGIRAGTGDQAATMPSGITTLNLGSNWWGGVLFNGHFHELRYYNVRKDNQFLEDPPKAQISKSGVPKHPMGLQSDFMYGQ